MKISSSDYYRKEDVTITYSGEVALRFCIQIAEQLKDVKQAQWYDWEFGPTENDPSGQDTIGLPNQTDSTIWLRTEELGMNEFSNSQCYLQRYSSGILAVHELLPKSLLGLAQRDVNAFNWQSKIDFSVRNIDSSALKPLFAGVYPLVFHSFARK